MPTIHASIDLAIDPHAAFHALVDELTLSFDRIGLRVETGPGGHVVEGSHVVGRIVAWEDGERIALEWRPADWEPGETTMVELRVEPRAGGTRIVLEHQGWGRVVGEPEELVGWFAGQVAAPILSATAPKALGDWITDRRARRPSGAQARGIYRDPLYHYPNFAVILEELALTPADHLLEVACGGGALLKSALESGCRAAAVDHSADMVRLARHENAQAVADGRLDVRQAPAEALPFADGTFTCATMTGVFGFLADPVKALAEIRRVLRPGGRIVVMGSDPHWKGTPAAPEPMASRLNFYSDDELSALADQAGLDEVRVVRRDLEPHARRAGVPDEHIPLFAGHGAPYLLARRHRALAIGH